MNQVVVNVLEDIIIYIETKSEISKLINNREIMEGGVFRI